jgi:hypothetical protein
MRKWLVLDEDGVVHECWCYNEDDAAEQVAKERNEDGDLSEWQLFRVRADDGTETEHAVLLEFDPTYTSFIPSDSDRKHLPVWPEAKGD